MGPIRASLKFAKSIPSLCLLTARIVSADLADRLAERRAKKRREKCLRKTKSLREKLMKIEDAEQKDKPGPEELENPFPPKKNPTESPKKSPSGEPSSTSKPLDEAARAELEDLCVDGTEGFHSLLQCKFPDMPDLPEKNKKRVGRQLEKTMERAGVTVAPGLGLGMALLAAYAPMIKYMKPKPQPKPKPPQLPGSGPAPAAAAGGTAAASTAPVKKKPEDPEDVER